MATNHKIIFGDSRLVLPHIESESVALVVTSPPYFVGREYEEYIEGETEYWQLMSDVFHEVERVIEPYGKVAINFADRYANSKLLGRVQEILYAHKYHYIMDGFDLWARIIWDKKKVFIDGANHLAHPNNRTGQMRVAPNWEYVMVWRKRSTGTVPKKNVDMTKEERIAWTDSIWSFDSVTVNEKEQGFKLAKFPEILPYRLIKMYSEEGDTILDPFGGTCTVARVAINLGRNSICIERNSAFENYIRGYLGVYRDGIQQDMFLGAPNIELMYGEGYES